jgi:hypothetical protein
MCVDRRRNRPSPRCQRNVGQRQGCPWPTIQTAPPGANLVGRSITFFAGFDFPTFFFATAAGPFLQGQRRSMAGALVGAPASAPEVGTLLSQQFSQYLLLSRLQVSPEKLLSESAPIHHFMQLLLVKSRLAPSSGVLDNSASIKFQIVLGSVRGRGHGKHGAMTPSASPKRLESRPPRPQHIHNP